MNVDEMQAHLGEAQGEGVIYGGRQQLRLLPARQRAGDVAPRLHEVRLRDAPAVSDGAKDRRAAAHHLHRPWNSRSTPGPHRQACVSGLLQAAQLQGRGAQCRLCNTRQCALCLPGEKALQQDSWTADRQAGGLLETGHMCDHQLNVYFRAFQVLLQQHARH